MELLPPALFKHKGVVAGVGLTIVLAIAAAAGHSVLADLGAVQAEQRALEQRMVRLQRGNDAMRRHLERMQADPAYLERVIRERLGWSRPGEVVYRVEGGRL